MQQPPGRPGPQGYPPYGGTPPGAPRPPGYVHPPGAPAPPPAQQPYPPAGARLPTGSVRKNRGSLKFLASSCIVTAWLTLILSMVGAIGSFVSGAGIAAATSASSGTSHYFPPPTAGEGAGAPEAGSPDGGLLGGAGGGGLGLPGGGAGGAMAGPMALFSAFLPRLCYLGGVFTLVTGIVTFFMFLGLGQACYILVDLEEQNFQMNQTLQIIVARLGVGR